MNRVNYKYILFNFILPYACQKLFFKYFESCKLITVLVQINDKEVNLYKIRVSER